VRERDVAAHYDKSVSDTDPTTITCLIASYCSYRDDAMGEDVAKEHRPVLQRCWFGQHLHSVAFHCMHVHA